MPPRGRSPPTTTCGTDWRQMDTPLPPKPSLTRRKSVGRPSPDTTGQYTTAPAAGPVRNGQVANCGSPVEGRLSERLGHVALIDHNPRRGEKRQSAPAEAIRYRQRSSSERANSHLHDNHGGRHVRVRGAVKVAAHLSFGLLVIAAEQLLAMLCRENRKGRQLTVENHRRKAATDTACPVATLTEAQGPL